MSNHPPVTDTDRDQMVQTVRELVRAGETIPGGGVRTQRLVDEMRWSHLTVRRHLSDDERVTKQMAFVEGSGPTTTWLPADHNDDETAESAAESEADDDADTDTATDTESDHESADEDRLVADGGEWACSSCGESYRPHARAGNGLCVWCDAGTTPLLADGQGYALSWADLTAFQRDLLVAIARVEADPGATPYGLAIKGQIERQYTEEVNHGRLYPNLDTLVESGLVEKQSLDKRSNEYTLAEAAREMLREATFEYADAAGMRSALATDGGSR